MTKTLLGFFNLLVLTALLATTGIAEESTISSALPDANADPHIACFGGTYYIYPTTDGFSWLEIF